MKIIVASFDHNYYLWQILVQINNFIKYGYDEDTIYIISSSETSPVLKSLMNHPKIKSKFFIYKDERKNSIYPVSLRHFLLERFYRENPEYSKEAVLLTDPDVVFTKKLDFTEMLNDDTWYFSDTRSYIDSNYIKSKGVYLFNEMCELVGVSPNEVSLNDKNAGGAQYLMKNINSDFWKKTYDDCEKLYGHMLLRNKEVYSNNPIQAWTADMWSIFWNGLYFKHNIKIDKKMDFCWAVDHIKRWNETYIFHNAGIPGDSLTHFSKITYQDSPFNKNITVSEDNCTYMYYKELKETEERFKDILW